MELSIVKADKNLFAVYHAIYINADIEMWYDWDKRLSETTWSDNCCFVISEGQKIGGAIIEGAQISHAFIIPPFRDRFLFWEFLTKETKCKKVIGALDCEVPVLLSLGYKIKRIGQVMCRPTDMVEHTLKSGFSCRAIDVNNDAYEITDVLARGYSGGICNEINGVPTREKTLEDYKYVCGVYEKTSWSHVIVDDATGKIAAVCLVGVGKDYVHNYAEIADICVLPEYRRNGLGKYMIAKAITDAFGTSPFIKLFVYVGNSAESLYIKMGFIAGSRFTNMEKRI